ncbi:hypothetical protein Vretimale_18949 [Volvox reticuliferus]|uniref:Uncharacterized protein n=1 Tax=Volvox reticuliferus TaxID=1737510 RepID=A0A8J4LZ68_9CHLO|nr:hypothetical protein Vretimale_18850 [Volvox reticuliferus]GIM16316.1 hypothetical protein Vretimale_18949 [Volvox reticuliferus]
MKSRMRAKAVRELGGIQVGWVGPGGLGPGSLLGRQVVKVGATTEGAGRLQQLEITLIQQHSKAGQSHERRGGDPSNEISKSAEHLSPTHSFPASSFRDLPSLDISGVHINPRR